MAYLIPHTPIGSPGPPPDYPRAPFGDGGELGPVGRPEILDDPASHKPLSLGPAPKGNNTLALAVGALVLAYLMGWL